MKLCKWCNKNKKDFKSKNQCLDCYKNYQKQYREKNQDRIKSLRKKHSDKRSAQRAAIRKQKLKLQGNKNEYIANYLKQNPCVDCGETNILVLDFDHISEKITEVSKLRKRNVPLSTLQKEIEKCEVRCKNCHGIKTSYQVNSWRLDYV